MNTTISLTLIAIGLVLIAVGVLTMDLFRSDVSRAFAGASTDKAVWMLLAGAVAAMVGLSGDSVFGLRSKE